MESRWGSSPNLFGKCLSLGMMSLSSQILTQQRWLVCQQKDNKNSSYSRTEVLHLDTPEGIVFSCRGTQCDFQLPLGEALHGHHLHVGEAFRAVGQARGLTPAEAASHAPGNAFVPANKRQLCHELVRHGLRFLLLQRMKFYLVN